MRYFLLLIIIFSISAHAQPAGSRGEPKLILPIGHTDIINSVEFSQDGKKILTASDDKTVKVWDTENGILLLNLADHTKRVDLAHFSKDGKKILSMKVMDNNLKIWDAEAGLLLHTLELENKGPIYDAKFSPDDKTIVICADDHLFFYNVISGRKIRSLDMPTPITVVFSPDGRNILLSLNDKTARIINTATGKSLLTIQKDNANLSCLSFSPDGKKIMAVPEGQTPVVWDSFNGKILHELKNRCIKGRYAEFSPDGKSILTICWESLAQVWDAATGSLKYDFKYQRGNIKSARFSPDNQYIVASTTDKRECFIIEARSGNYTRSLKDETMNERFYFPQFSPDGKRIITQVFHIPMIWDVETGGLLKTLEGHNSGVMYTSVNPDGSKIACYTSDGSFRLWDVKKGSAVNLNKDPSVKTDAGVFSPDGSRILSICSDYSLRIWDTTPGIGEIVIKGHRTYISEAAFSPDGKKIVTASEDSTVKIWDAINGDLRYTFYRHHNKVESASFSHDGKKIVSASDSTIILWDVVTGNVIDEFTLGSCEQLQSVEYSKADNLLLIRCGRESIIKILDRNTGKTTGELSNPGNSFYFAKFSPDGKLLMTADLKNGVQFWDAFSNKKLDEMGNLFQGVEDAEISPDGTKIILNNIFDNKVTLHHLSTGKLIAEMKGHNDYVDQVQFSEDNKLIVTSSMDNTAKIWDAVTGKLYYTFFFTDSTDYLVTDEYGRYDGTEAARKFLYYTCGSDIINLDQFKDLSWEPGLANKIMNGEQASIAAKKLSEIDICDATPVIEDKRISGDLYQFEITPRRKGIGDVQVYVNNKMVRSYPVSTLVKKGSKYQLIFKKEEFQSYFLPGSVNQVTVKATTRDNSMISRGGTVGVVSEQKIKLNPNIYILSVGISQYKSNALRLDYAAKDAREFSTALTQSARKLLNTDDAEHVTTFNFTTDEENKNWPFKKTLVRTLDSISKKAKAEDIFVFFFAGHGTLKDDKKNLFLLTAEASAFELGGVEKDVALSFNELKGWMQKIKANKQLLILDACRSGLAVDLLSGLTKKRSIPIDQVWALEDMKDKTGTYILTASSSEQNGYESNLYNQGILTYCLLSGIKLGEGLKDNKYIDVTKWFNTTANNVKMMALELGKIQEPRLLGNASFNIGLVDKDVVDNIKLSIRKKVFRRSSFVSDGPIPSDNLLEMSSHVDKALNQVSARGKESPLSFIPDTKFADQFSIVGNYHVAGNDLNIKCYLLKGKDVKPLYEFELKGFVDTKEKLATDIVDLVKKWLEEH